jgi:hypothetical protein
VFLENARLLASRRDPLPHRIGDPAKREPGRPPYLIDALRPELAGADHADGHGHLSPS